ncbi:collagen alpha-1(I) chain [Camelus dromedarius]|uniref:collagen alpha-1(I) chain n=1 Tax=Camelus dromedarius TaxID=9838 RepID=UPI00311A51B5
MGAWRGGARPAGGGGVASVACARTLRGAALVLGAASTPGWGRRARADRRRGSASEGGTAGPPFPERGGGRVQRGRGAAAVQAPVRAPQPGDTGLCRAGAARRGVVDAGARLPFFFRGALRSTRRCGPPRPPLDPRVSTANRGPVAPRGPRGIPGWISSPPLFPGRPAVAAASRLPAARGGSPGGSLPPPLFPGRPAVAAASRLPAAREGFLFCMLGLNFGRLCLSKRAVFCRSSAGGLIGRVGPSMAVVFFIGLMHVCGFVSFLSTAEPSSRGTESSALCCAVRPRGRICQERTYKDLEDPGKLLPSRILHGCSRSCGWTDGRTEDGSNGGPAPSPGPLGPGGS